MKTAAIERTPATRRGPTRRQLTRHVEGWLFASPWIVGFLLFTAGPMLFSAAMAFTTWDLINSPRWVGLDNWRLLAGGDALALGVLRPVRPGQPLPRLRGRRRAQVADRRVVGAALARDHEPLGGRRQH